MDITLEQKKEVYSLFRRFDIKTVSEKSCLPIDIIISLKEEYDVNVAPRYNEFKEVSISLDKDFNIDTLESYRVQYIHNYMVQNLLITKCLKIGAYDLIHKIYKEYAGDIVFDSQYVKYLMRMGHFRDAIQICNKYPESVDFQNKLRHINSIILKNNISLTSKLDETESSISSEDNNRVTQIMEIIREKLQSNNFENDDFLLVDELEDSIDDTIYKFILVAIYTRKRMISSAMQVLKSIENSEYKKIKNKLVTLLNNKKMANFYDMGLFDEIIGWTKTSQNICEAQVAKVKRAKIIG